MLDELKNLIDTYGAKHYTRAIRKHAVLLKWIEAETAHMGEVDLPERVYWCLNRIDPNCEIGNRKKFAGLTVGYRFCSASCACRRAEQARKMGAYHAGLDEQQKSTRVEKQQQTLFERTGVRNPMHVNEYRAAQAATNQERYGGSSPLASAVVQAKIKETIRRNHGVDAPFQSAEVRKRGEETKLAKYGDRYAMHLAREAYFEQTGYRNPFDDPAIQARARASMLSSHGVEHALSSPIILNDMQQKLLEQYGVDNVMKRPDVAQSLRDYWLNRYGRSNGMQVHFSDATYDVLSASEKFAEMFATTSLREMAQNLNVGYDTLRKYCVRYGIPLPRSSYETSLAVFLQEHGCEVVQNTRSLINPHELDLYVSQHNTAIEFCGLYWHSEKFKPPTYHQRKLFDCDRAGIRLLTVFEDEWVQRRSVVESRILNILGKSPRGVGARKLRISEIDPHAAQLFFDQYHLQGSRIGFVTYGAFCEYTLVAAMSFGRPRAALGRRSGAPELLRFATNGASYPGVASRLLRQFVRVYKPDSIISYADLRYSRGALYENLGFVRRSTTRPNYWYIPPNRIERKHRFGFRRDRLLKLFGEEAPADKTERQIMNELGYLRIYDCGSAVYELAL